MVFFSFISPKESLSNLLGKIEPDQKYYSKDISLWNELNNKNNQKKNFIFSRELRFKTKTIGKKILICLPPKFGLGDAIEYGIAFNSLIESRRFTKIGLAFCNNYNYIFKHLFSFKNIYLQFISDNELKKYDTIFHLTLEIEALKYQKYSRSNIVSEICKFFKVKKKNYKINKSIFSNTFKNTISVFPISTSMIRSMPLQLIEGLIENFKDKYQIKIIIDESDYSKYLVSKILKSKEIKFIKPLNIESLIKEVINLDYGVFIDSGPLHIAKIFDKEGVLIETTVSKDILLSGTNKIDSIDNKYVSSFCRGPCGLVDIFSFKDSIGCYETNETSFKKIKKLDNFKSLQRLDKKYYNRYFINKPVGCIAKINIDEVIKLIKLKLKT